MSNLKDAYINALLADATYALGDLTTNGMAGTELEAALRDRMTPALAAYISENFIVVTHIETNDTLVGSGFDATVWRDRSGQLYVSMQGTTGYGDLVTDIDLAIDGAAKAQIVDMVNWWLRHITPPEASWAPQFELNGDEEIIPSASVQGTGLLTNVSGLSVSGHSLGGHLATAFTRLFGGTPDYIDHTYTYNSGGFNGFSNSFFGPLEQLLAEIGIDGMGTFPGTSQQSNFFAE